MRNPWSSKRVEAKAPPKDTFVKDELWAKSIQENRERQDEAMDRLSSIHIPDLTDVFSLPPMEKRHE